MVVNNNSNTNLPRVNQVSLGLWSLLAILFLFLLAGACLYIFISPSGVTENPRSGIDKQINRSSFNQASPPNQTFDHRALDVYADQYIDLGPLPEYMSGADVDVYFEFDANGQLATNIGLMYLFEYYFSLLEEAPLDHVFIRVAHFLKSNLSNENALTAWDAFEQYIAYLEKLEQSSVDYIGGEMSRREYLDFVKSIRQEALSPNIYEGFFLEEEQYDEFSISRAEILKSESLSQEEKQLQIKELEQSIPADMLSRLQKAEKISTVMELTTEMRASGADENEIHWVNEQAFGAEAADRLSELNIRRKNWDDKYEQYRTQLTAINNSAQAEVDKQREIESLREQYFTPNQRKRVRYLDSTYD